MPRIYLWLAGAMMATGSMVWLEPAPYDIALVLLLAAGVLLGRLAFGATHRLPLLLLAGFLVANAVSFGQAANLRRAAAYAGINAYMAISWFFFAGLTTAHGRRAIPVLMRGYTLAGVLAVVLSTLAFFGFLGSHPQFLGSGRAQGLFKDPNVYGPYLVPILLYALAQWQGSRWRSWKFLLMPLLCAVAALGIFLSFSRAAWISCVVATGCFLGFQFVSGLMWRKLSVGLVLSILLLALLAGGVATLAATGDSPVGRMLADRLGDRGIHDYDAMRFYTQHRALEAVRENPLGIGPGQAEIVFQYATHSMYLRILAENGVLGFVAFYGFVLLSFLRASKNALYQPGKFDRDVFAIVGACLLGTLINGLVIDTIHWRHLWFLLGLAWWVPQGADDAEVAKS